MIEIERENDNVVDGDDIGDDDANYVVAYGTVDVTVVILAGVGASVAIAIIASDAFAFFASSASFASDDAVVAPPLAVVVARVTSTIH